MDAFLSAFFYFAMAFVFAGIEVEVEGAHGWAANLPTWKRKTGLAAKLYGMLMNGKPLTGYHAYMFFLPLFIFHLPYLGLDKSAWTIKGELFTIGLYFAFAAVWDFLWFVINPHFGVKNFKKENVWWHAKSPWILGLPMDYWSAFVLSLILGFFGGAIVKMSIVWAVFISLTAICIFFAPAYHHWYQEMRRKSE